MDYYKGNVNGNDQLKNGGTYVLENGDAHEKYNFSPVLLSKDNIIYPDGEYCLGFVETKSTNGKTRNQLNIEKIEGYEALKSENEAEDVLVIYCAKFSNFSTYEIYVVGQYKHATVYRNYTVMEFDNGEDGIYGQFYNAIAKKSDCVRLPRGLRCRSNIWRVPRKKGGISYGFGRSNVWFAADADRNDRLKRFLDCITKQIEKYLRENWIDKYE